MTRFAGSLIEVGICERRTTTTVVPRSISAMGVSRGGLEPSEIRLTGDVNTELSKVAGNKAGATGVSNETAWQFLFTANLTHTKVELELASVAGVWKEMGFSGAREAREALFPLGTRERPIFPFPSNLN